MNIRPGKKLLLGLLVPTGMVITGWAWPWVSVLAVSWVITLAVFAGKEYRTVSQEIKTLSVLFNLPVMAARGASFTAECRIKGLQSRTSRGEFRVWVPTEAQPDVWREECIFDQGGECAFSADFVISERGEFVFAPVWVRLVSPSGLIEVQAESTKARSIKIMPESSVQKSEFEKVISDRVIMQDKIHQTHRTGEGFDFESLSDFRQGDDIQKIDWKATARHRKLLVRRYEIERHKDIVVMVDCGRLMGAVSREGTKLDNAVDSALMISRVALARGDRCGFGVFDDRIRKYMVPRGGNTAYGLILEEMFDVKSGLRETDFSRMFAHLQTRQRKRSLLIILSDIVDMETSSSFRSACLALSKRHAVLFCAIRTPYLSALLRSKSETMEHVSQKMIVAKLLREREIALKTLSGAGIHVLDVEPEEITVGLINRYLKIREKVLL